MNKFNFNFDENDIPFGVGDRYYAQDMVRDNRYLQNLPLQILASTLQKDSMTLRGLVISKSSNTIISLTGGAGFCCYSVKIPDDNQEWSVPPQTKDTDIYALVNVESQAIQLTPQMLDGQQKYVKIKYKESTSNTRIRQNLGGVYPYVVSDSYDIIIDQNPPTKYEIALGSINGDGTSLNVDPANNGSANFITDLMYPVGSIYWSGVNVDPSTIFGGTWSQIKDRFLWAKGDDDTINDTGGAKTHTLTVSEMPSHTHTFTGSVVTSGNNSVGHTHTFSGTTGGMSANATGTIISAGSSTGNIKAGTSWNSFCGNYNTYGTSNKTLDVSHTHTYSGTTSAISANHTHSVTAKGTNSNTGGGTAHNNMPPYIVKYCWERIA